MLNDGTFTAFLSNLFQSILRASAPYYPYLLKHLCCSQYKMKFGRWLCPAEFLCSEDTSLYAVLEKNENKWEQEYFFFPILAFAWQISKDFIKKDLSFNVFLIDGAGQETTNCNLYNSSITSPEGRRREHKHLLKHHLLSYLILLWEFWKYSPKQPREKWITVIPGKEY